MVAAGRGLRALSAANKVLVRAGSTPILHFSLKRFAALEECAQIILVVNPDDFKKGLFDKEKLVHDFGVNEIIEGGEHRAGSVRNGFAAADPEISLVVIHDAARPFVSSGTILAVAEAAETHGAAIAAVQAGDTLKAAGPDMFVEKTIPRENVYRAQTPQAFKRELLKQAFASAPSGELTDEAQLVELLGEKVKLVESRTTNIKVTTPEDLEMALRLLPVWDVEDKK